MQHGEITDTHSNSSLHVFAFTTLGGWTKAARKYLKDAFRGLASKEKDKVKFAAAIAYNRHAARLVSSNVLCLTEGLSTYALDSED